jgi:hypothetical protein
MNNYELANIFNYAILDFMSAPGDIKPIMIEDETEDGKSENPQYAESDVESIMQRYAKGDENKSFYNYKDENYHNENKSDTYNYVLGSADVYNNKSTYNGNEGLVNYYKALSGADNFEKSSEYEKNYGNIYGREYTNIFSSVGDSENVYKNTSEKNNGVNESTYKKEYGSDTSIYKAGYYGKNYGVSNDVFNSVYGFGNVSNGNIYGIDYGLNDSAYIFDKGEKGDIYGFGGNTYHDFESLSKYGEYADNRYVSENTVGKENKNFTSAYNYGDENGFNIFGKYTDLSFGSENSKSDYAFNTESDYLNNDDVFNIDKGISKNTESYSDYDIGGNEEKSEFFSKIRELTNETNNYNNSGGSININMGGVTQNFASGEGADSIMDIFVESLRKGLSGCGSRYLEAD